MKPDHNKKLISHHSFMFPFRWDTTLGKPSKYLKNRSVYEINPPFESRVDVQTFKTVLCRNPCWQLTPFTITAAKDFNEYIYFYPHARKAIYNTHKTFTNRAITHSFTYKNPECRYYTIHISGTGEEGPRRLTLDITGITLIIYDAGVGILIFDLENRRNKAPEDILLINDFGRRIHPPFLGDLQDDSAPGIDAAHKAVYPVCIEMSKEIPLTLPKEICKQEASYYNSPEKMDPSFNQEVTRLPGFIHTLLGPGCDTRLNGQEILLTPAVDDRMFVICVYGDTTGDLAPGPWDACGRSADLWYRFLFVDGKYKGIANKEFEKDLVQDHTYARWREYGTYYGITRYAFTAWVKGDIEHEFPKLILTHCNTLYRRMMILALAQRVTILRFSEEIAHISGLEKNSLSDDELEAVKNLYRHYIRFVNQVYFTEVTAQEQGIEMYSMIQRHLNIQENLGDLRREIGELHAFADLCYEKKRGKRADSWTVLAALFLIPTLITGFFGMNVFSPGFFNNYGGVPGISFLKSEAMAFIVFWVPPAILLLFALVWWIKRWIDK